MKRSFKRTVVPDRLDLRDRPYLPTVREAPRPELNTLEACSLQALDQRDSSACTGFALAQVVNCLLLRAKRREQQPVSPYMLYSMARRYDEFPGYTADDGSSLRGALKGWYHHGVCCKLLWDSMPMPPLNQDPTEDWYQDSARRPMGAYYRIDTRSVTDMQVALNEVGVIYASAVCHSGWELGDGQPQTATTPIWQIPPQKAGPADGGHAFAIVGYNRHGFLILNSWGPSWGLRGAGILTYEDWLDHAMDCWVTQLGVVTDQHLQVAGATTLRFSKGKGKAPGTVVLAADGSLRDQELSPFILDMENNGSLSNHGRFRTRPEDVHDLVTHHLPKARAAWGNPGGPLDVAVYAHGGLTSEEEAAKTAAKWIPALYEARIFPIFLMWETDLLSTIKNRLADRIADFLAPEAGRTAGWREQVANWFNTRIERTLAVPGSCLWDETKQNADALSQSPQSGARLLYRYGMETGALKPAKVRLHLIGHSAGAIVHSHIIGRLAPQWRFETVTFMAPAVRWDLFEQTVLPHLKSGVVRRYRQFHLFDELERKDPTCRALLGYGRSLLYLVSESFERGRSVPILGMEKFFSARLRPLTSQLKGRLEAIAGGEIATHGGFDDDVATRKRVIAGIVAAR